ncbi:hypothetical protein SAMN02787118_11141 [Streptomyces mirabilis]|uniref:Uncharacterized protein n=1 Tax=Streptomyces mirabilis TaxID=68239 RepID=A0A1I2KYV1_9ACTN|nr:hypothetical protein SAMN02787118_11141 [Streptomyces mirabilis]
MLRSTQGGSRHRIGVRKRDRIHAGPGARGGHPVHAFCGYLECEPPWARNALTVDQAVRARGYVQATSSVAASTVWGIL